MRMSRLDGKRQTADGRRQTADGEHASLLRLENRGADCALPYWKQFADHLSSKNRDRRREATTKMVRIYAHFTVTRRRFFGRKLILRPRDKTCTTLMLDGLNCAAPLNSYESNYISY